MSTRKATVPTRENEPSLRNTLRAVEMPSMLLPVLLPARRGPRGVVLRICRRPKNHGKGLCFDVSTCTKTGQNRRAPALPGREGQPDSEDCAFPGLALQGNGSAVGLDDVLANDQAKSHTGDGSLPAGPGAEKLREDLCLLSLGHAYAGVGNLESQAIRSVPRPHRDPAAVGGVFHCVEQQVVDHLAYPLRVQESGQAQPGNRGQAGPC